MPKKRKAKVVYGPDGVQRSLSEELVKLREFLRVAVTASDIRATTTWLDCVIEDVRLRTYD